MINSTNPSIVTRNIILIIVNLCASPKVRLAIHYIVASLYSNPW
jgi:hypothetical protein